MKKLIYLAVFILMASSIYGISCFDDGYDRLREVSNLTNYSLGTLLNESVNGTRIWFNPYNCGGNVSLCWESSNESNISIYCNGTTPLPFERNDNASGSYNITDVYDSDVHFANHLENSSYNDSSNNHMYLINNGAVFNSSGKIGGAYNFSGDAGSYMYTSKTLFKSEHNFTINIWMYANNINSGSFQHLINTIDTVNPKPETFVIRIDNDDNKMYIFKRTGITTDVDYVNADLSGLSKKWVMVTFAFNDSIGNSGGAYLSGAMNLYINGELIDKTAQDANHNGFGNYNNELWLGTFNPTKTDQNFIGLLDEVRVWNRTLTPEEIEQVYNSTNLTTKYNLLGAEQSAPVTVGINTTIVTPVDNANITDSNNISVNYTVSGNLTPIDTQWYSVDDNATNTTITGNFSVVLSNGLYNLTICANTTGGNESCDTHAINVSVLSVSITSPTNTTYTGSNILDVTYYYSGNTSPVDVQWYSIDNYTTNTTIPGNFSRTFTNGSYKLYLCVNLTSGLESCDDVSFTTSVYPRWVIIDDMNTPPQTIFKINRATGEVYIYGELYLYGNITYI